MTWGRDDTLSFVVVWVSPVDEAGGQSGKIRRWW